MKKTILLYTIFYLISHIPPVLACTTIVVGKEASTDGSIIIARNIDSPDATTPQNLMWHPFRKDSYSFISNFANNQTNNVTFSWKMPPDTLSYIAFPQWNTVNKHSPSYEETGINADGVAISATESIFNNNKVLSIDPYTAKGITEDAIASVILAQATSASEGIRKLGEMIEQDGAGAGFGVAIVDRNEVWYLETASGHHWVAQRIPDNAYFVSANQGRFQDIDFDNTMSVMSSPDLRSFMAKNGLYNPNHEPFNLFKCCMENSAIDQNYNAPRVAQLLKLFSGEAIKNQDGQYPVFLNPSHALSKDDIAAGLRNHYNDTANDPYQNQNPNTPWRPISVLRTSLSHITQVFPEQPSDIAFVQYIALGMSDLSAYIPLYKGLTTLPKEYQGAVNIADSSSLYWMYRKMQALVMQDYPKYAPEVKAAFADLESEIAQQQEKMRTEYLSVWFQNRDQARESIQNLTNHFMTRQKSLLSQQIQQLAIAQSKSNMTNQDYTQMLQDIERKYHFDSGPGRSD